MDEAQQNQTSMHESVGFPGAQPMQQQPAPTKKNWKWLIILVLFLVVIGAVTFFVFKSSRTASTLDESPTPDTSNLTNVPTPAPTTTPSSAPVDKSTVKVQILNGTGIAGEAGLLSDKLKALGYTNISTGNASTQNSTTTQVTFGSGVSSDVTTEITSALNGFYTDVTTSNSALSDFDIQITTGLRKGQTAAPAATDTPAATSSPTPTATP